ncbi:MAG: UDP-N-acetylmuramate--L-alanine ligase [Candidatus Jacksonbacteria bacterium]
MKHKTFFNQHNNIYFIGIGGIGVSALAKLALTSGCQIFGSDLIDSDIIADLKKLGAKIKIGKTDPYALLKKKIDLVIYSTAVPDNALILTQARRLKIPIKTYPQILGEISKQYFTIAVSGMHGKSTTTAMIGLMLESAGLDPLVIVGTKVKEWEGNIKIPHGTWNMEHGTKEKKSIFIVEADEYRSAMLNLSPDIIVLTRIEEDHLDYYKNLTHIKREFRKYLTKLPADGCAIVNWADKNIQSIVRLFDCSIVKYNYQDDDTRQKIKKILKVPGEHNLENALAAYKVGERLGLTQKQILTGLSKFKGTWRRQELVGYFKLPLTNYPLPIISDYAHHPTEIKATLQALREKYPKLRILLAYQPHQHNRTKMLFNDFVNAFDQADILILNEIFDVAGREANLDQDVSSQDLALKINQKIKRLKIKNLKLKICYYTKTLAQTKNKILTLVQPNDIIVIMGAGDIDQVARDLASDLVYA